MNAVNKTLYIPLYGKSYVSKKGLFLCDKKAEEIWAAEGFSLKGKSKSKWLAYYMGIRSAVFDDWTRAQMAHDPGAVVLHIGCGMDSRILRVGTKGHKWYDVDFPAVIDERGRYFAESSDYHMLAGNAAEPTFLDSIPETDCAIVVMEGVSMYLTVDQMKALARSLCDHFSKVYLIMDCYSTLAAQMSKYKNPINDVGVTEVYGIDDPQALQENAFTFVCEHDLTPKAYIDALQGMERHIFRKLYAGGFAKKLYRLFEYKKA